MNKSIFFYLIILYVSSVCGCKSKSKVNIDLVRKDTEIYFSDFLGNTPIGINRDISKVFQKAVNEAARSQKVLIIESGTYFLAKTIFVSSNTTVVGRGNVRIIGKYNFAPKGQRGGYPTTLFTNIEHNKGNQNIRFENIIFDGNRQKAIKNFTKALPHANTLKFKNVQGLIFDDCQIVNHLSTIPTPYIDDFQAARNCVAVNIERCDTVSFRRCKMQGIHNEGIWFYRSTAVVVDKLESVGTRGISTHLSFLYCDGVQLLNSKLTYELQGGSTINCESSNVLIKNNQFIGGRGIDISNEAEFESFEPHHVTIESNELDVYLYGIVRRKGKSMLKDYIIKDNNIRINGQNWLKKPWQTIAIRIDDTENTRVENNSIEVYNFKKGDFYIAIGATGNSEKNITIQKNKVRGVDCFYYGTTHYGSKSDINILNNEVDLNELRGEVSEGYSSGIYIYNMPYTKGRKEFIGLHVESNTFRNCAGDCITFLARKPYKMDKVSVKGNTFEKKGKQNNNGIRIEGTFSTDSKDMKIEDNRFKNIKILTSKSKKGIQLNRNKVLKN